jgi:hypothetical protein
MTNCPPVPVSPTQYDLRQTTNCIDILRSLMSAYYAALTGNQRVIVRFAERWTEYQRVNVEELRMQYQILYNQCPAAKSAGLPNLNPALQARRGAPTRGFSHFGRL